MVDASLLRVDAVAAVSRADVSDRAFDRGSVVVLPSGGVVVGVAPSVSAVSLRRVRDPLLLNKRVTVYTTGRVYVVSPYLADVVPHGSAGSYRVLP